MQTTVISRRIAARMRSTVVKAFRRLARGAADKAAYAATVAFYKSTGHAWAKQLGG
jgi:hypothetical protein